MKNLILVAGLPASGKTSFCDYLTKALQIPVISKDTIKASLYEVVGFDNLAQKKILGEASFNIMYIVAAQSMKIGLPVILEGNFDSATLPDLKELIQKYGYHCIAVRFGGDLRIIYDRFIKRCHSSTVESGHVSAESLPAGSAGGASGSVIQQRPDFSFEQFRDMVIQRGIMDFSLGNDLICVDSSDFSKVDYSAICDDIREKMRIFEG